MDRLKGRGKENSRVRRRRGSEKQPQGPARLSGRGMGCDVFDRRFGQPVALSFPEYHIALRSLFRDAGVSSEVCSLSSRLLLSLFLHKASSPPRIQVSTFHGELSSKLQQVCIEVASPKAVVLGRALSSLTNLCDQSVSAHRGRVFEGCLIRFLG